MLKENYVTAYIMRVDERGQQYQGYLSECEIRCKSSCVYKERGYIVSCFCEKAIEKESESFVRIENLGQCDMYEDFEMFTLNSDIILICKQDAVVRGLPLNRVVYDEAGKFITILAGNIFAVRRNGTEFMSICDEDIEIINQCLKPIVRIFNGKIDTKSVLELPKWSNTK